MTQPAFCKWKVLLIEDNERNRYLTTFLLEKSGYQVLQAVDGPTGIEMVEQVEPDLILLDIQLPGMDGYTVATELTKNRGRVDIPIVAVTSYAMVGDRERALSSGCVGYIEKPINPETFVSQMEQYLDPHKLDDR